MANFDEFQNRLRKRTRALKAWHTREKLSAYRIYQRDLPNFPFYVDRYGDHVVIFENSPPDKPVPPWELTRDAVAEALDVAPERAHYKSRKPMKGNEQYQRLGEKSEIVWVTEYKATLKTNLSDYLDTGLFLDHRPTRKKFGESNTGTFLNLFCYTGSVSVAAALGGAAVTSVDMSNTYLDWAKENFTKNQIKGEFVRANVLEYLSQAPKAHFDTIFLDPPSFSNSKRMASTFDVQRDQVELIRSVSLLLKEEGRLVFSNNRRGFRLDPSLESLFHVEDTTDKTVPFDFSSSRPHRSFEIRKRRKRLAR